MIPFSRPFSAESERAAVHDLVRSVGQSRRYMLGELCRELEEDVASRIGVTEAVVVGGTSAALHLALGAVEVGPGDEVIMPALADPMVASQIVALGAKPVFADVIRDGLVVAPESIAARITAATRAILVLHGFSCLADMPRIRVLADRNNLALVEHACSQLAADCHGLSAGRWGDIGVVSLTRSNLASSVAEGAVLVTNNVEAAARSRLVRNHGHDPSEPVKHIVLGLNLRMDEIVAGQVLRGLPRLDQDLQRSREIAQAYRERLCDIPNVIVPPSQDATRPCAHDFVILSAERDALGRFLSAKGVESRVHISSALPQHDAFRNYASSAHPIPHAQRAADEHLALPIYPELRDHEIETIADAVRAFFELSNRTSFDRVQPTRSCVPDRPREQGTAPAHGPS